MFKKIAIVAVLAVSASFATWDYFPVLEAGKGSAEVGMYYDWHDEWSQAGLKAGARYTLFQNFELALMGLGYQFWSETDCDGCYNGGDGFRDLVIGARYQVAPMITAALDLGLPVGGKEAMKSPSTAPFSSLPSSRRPRVSPSVPKPVSSGDLNTTTLNAVWKSMWVPKSTTPLETSA